MGANDVLGGFNHPFRNIPVQGWTMLPVRMPSIAPLSSFARTLLSFLRKESLFCVFSVLLPEWKCDHKRFSEMWILRNLKLFTCSDSKELQRYTGVCIFVSSVLLMLSSRLFSVIFSQIFVLLVGICTVLSLRFARCLSRFHYKLQLLMAFGLLYRNQPISLGWLLKITPMWFE